uniref:C-type lectin domain-containing protein n=1 Tax=Neolamprologus brichardi TaxID=32507 RepID=A0A3Q4H4N1_NEOBR
MVFILCLTNLRLVVDAVCLFSLKNERLTCWVFFFFLVHQQYHFINKSLTWYEAQSFCRLKYTDLATINNMDDENRLINTLGSNVTSSWIGLYNGQTNRWLWSDGSGIASFTQWSPDEPNNSGGNESCGEMYDNGLWNDASCEFAMAYVCNQTALLPC